MYKLSIQSNKGPLEIKWTDTIQLAKYANIQHGHYLTPGCDFSPELLNKRLQEWQQMLWNMEHELGMHDFPNNSVFLDKTQCKSLVTFKAAKATKGYKTM